MSFNVSINWSASWRKSASSPDTQGVETHADTKSMSASWVCKSFCWARTYSSCRRTDVAQKVLCLQGMKLWALFHRRWRAIKDNTQRSQLFRFNFKQIMLAAMWVKDWRTTRLEAEIFLEKMVKASKCWSTVGSNRDKVTRYGDT